MKRVIYSPAKYIQEKGLISRLGEFMKLLEKKSAYILADPFIIEKYQEQIRRGFSEEYKGELEAFQGQCSEKEIRRIISSAQKSGAELIFGVGGGKVLDTAKAVSYFMGLPVAVVPTAASSDAPCSALSVLYREDGSLDRYLRLRENPALVLVDTEVVALAPPRFLTAGMGDALSTYYEVRACQKSRSATDIGGVGSVAAMALARCCRDILFTEGKKAQQDAKNGEITSELEDIIEVNIYLSGIGFESGGLAAAHSIHNGLTHLAGTKKLLHGELVAFTTLVQLILEKAPEKEIRQVLQFLQEVGLPTTLEQVGLKGVSQEELASAVHKAFTQGNGISHLPDKVTEDEVIQAILQVDQLK